MVINTMRYVEYKEKIDVNNNIKWRKEYNL